MVIAAVLPSLDTPDEDPLQKATVGKSYFVDQLHLFEAAGGLIYLTRTEANKQISLLEAIAGPLISGLAPSSDDLQAVLSVHHHLLALGNFAKGFPQVLDTQVEALPYQGPFKQMTEALLQTLEARKSYRVVRDSVSDIAATLTAGTLCILAVCQRHRNLGSRTRTAIRADRGHRV